MSSKFNLLNKKPKSKGKKAVKKDIVNEVQEEPVIEQEIEINNTHLDVDVGRINKVNKLLNKKNLFDSSDEEEEEVEIVKNTEVKTVAPKVSKCYYLSNKWMIWEHNNKNTNWDISSYKKIFEINSINTFWNFFNTFPQMDKFNYQYFIMKNNIVPIWEDNANKNGGICSFKIYYSNLDYRTNFDNEILTCLSMLIMNETFLLKNFNINGIQYALKKQTNNFVNNYGKEVKHDKTILYIKIWTANVKYDIINDLPKILISKLTDVLQSYVYNTKYEQKISIIYNPIQKDNE